MPATIKLPRNPANVKQLATLAFFAAYPGLHSFHKDTSPQVKSLERKGFLKVSWETMQAEFTGKFFA
jgi:hypothetical protein